MSDTGGGRRRGRELAMKLLYQTAVGGQHLDEAVKTFEEFASARPEAREFALALARGVADHRAEIDGVITAHLKDWTLERLGAIDAALLRVATFELLHLEDIPAKVTLDEAIGLSRQFSAGESGGFLNGVLDAVARSRAAHKLPNR